ncbi:hypothetical protein SARC_15136 [Sphaeroforma arctica JP610]|uniref:Uncharacterized protein n=1 Tax=Sphaeroforma arctica JP610 TaxID=667725 RepID=A0A0L0F6V8_9EUKA|nr:hypothetical protein SARC_15136 [Sphaeroforma arctica JP610]KNC72306.1 hypothetical protein SARC_15136 [Sphaeroforma arctica JP610]|eukprot:XP_014146208.1 hypothetical protein SARC_15136 [Sphaeroforma arctica JP610]
METTKKFDKSAKDLANTNEKLADTTKTLDKSTKDLADTTKRLDTTAKDLVDTTEKLETKTVECETLCEDLAAARAKQESKYLSQVQQRPILPDASGVASVTADANRLVHSFPTFREELMFFTWRPASSKYMSVGLRAELLQTMKKSDTIVRSLQALSINLQPSIKDVVDKLVIFGQGWNTYLDCSMYWHVDSRYALDDKVCANRTLIEQLKMYLSKL